jgi:hypothetical protein
MSRHTITTRVLTTELLVCIAPNGGVKVKVLLSNGII